MNERQSEETDKDFENFAKKIEIFSRIFRKISYLYGPTVTCCDSAATSGSCCRDSGAGCGRDPAEHVTHEFHQLDFILDSRNSFEHISRIFLE